MNFADVGFLFFAADERSWRPLRSTPAGIAIPSLAEFPMEDPLASYRRELRDAYARHKRQTQGFPPTLAPRGGRRS